VGRSRGRGGGRKRAEEHDPELAAALDKLVDPDSRGDPMTPLRWTSKSLRSLADQLRAQGHQVSPTLVQRLLHQGRLQPAEQHQNPPGQPAPRP
jgi:hypothetical protein